METTSDKLDALLTKVEKLNKQLNPDSDGENFELKLIADELKSLTASVESLKSELQTDTIADKLLDLEGLLSSQPTIDIKPLRNDIAELKTTIRLQSSNTVPSDEDKTLIPEYDPNPAWNKRMWRSVGFSLVFTCILSLVTFKYALPAFPLAYGLFTLSIGLLSIAFVDDIFLITNSMGKVAKDAKAIALFIVAIAILFFTGVSVGTTYISNPLGSENENAVKVIKYESASVGGAETARDGSRQTVPDPSATRSGGTNVFNAKDGGKPESEQ